MATVPEPVASGASEVRARPAEPGERERSRLRPPPQAPAHAPLLLGLDAAGGEHPQGPADPDDESLVGRCWGCVCGWRGTVRDVATRHFHPQVGDGGGLRRRRLARADRDARAELEHHLTATSPPAPVASTALVSPTPAGTTAVPAPSGGAARAHRRRRLTLPRTAPQLDDARATDDLHRPGEPHRDEPPRPPPLLPVAAPPLSTPLPAPPTDEDAADPGQRPPELADPDPGPDSTGGEVLDRAPQPSPACTPSAGVGEDELAAAAERARRARAELAAAETALDAAVATARARGASWRTIARATGVAHRDAAARWDSAGAGPSL